MKIGMIGLGKLGLPVALAIESKGHDVMGYDVNPKIADYLSEKAIPYREEGVSELLQTTKLKLGTVDEVVSHADLVFVAVQTPHDPRFEGIAELPKDRADFDYTYLREAVSSVAESAERQNILTRLVVISTVLPGTIDREIKPLLGEHIRLFYNPSFIAMGTTVQDFLHPEFTLIGSDYGLALTLNNFYKTIHDKTVFTTDIKTAELTKVAYNTFIGMKIVFANTMMEICHKTGANCDDLTEALSLARRRLVSNAYLCGGMGDGGGCHPRDNIAMSWLARNVRLSHDIFSDLMLAREDQSRWLSRLIEEEHRKSRLPIVILGKAYKPETNLIVGSPALLLAEQLRESFLEFEHMDPFVDCVKDVGGKPRLYFIATKHEIFAQLQYGKDSVVIDPWRYVPRDQEAKVIWIGNTNGS